MVEKYLSRRIREDIRKVLMDFWDPIGVNEIPEAQDEYDFYLGEVMELLVERKSDDEIAAHLLSIVNERMGLTASLKDMMPAVNALRSISLT
jgi:hypothetical protein